MSENEKEQLKLHHLSPAPGSKKKRIRVGRREGGRRGKTAGRGTKGLKARSKLRPGFQTPLAMRLPKLPGFRNPNREEFAIVNVAAFAAFDKGAEVTPETLREKGLIRHKGRVKVLAEGDLARWIRSLEADGRAVAGDE